MKLITTNILTEQQKNDAYDLINKCNLHDKVTGVSFFDSSMNYDNNFPCFYMMYIEDELISFLSVFIPELDYAEIYASTHPSYRNNNYFTRLLNSSLYFLKNFCNDYLSICIVADHACTIANTIAQDHGMPSTNSELLMKYDFNSSLPVLSDPFRRIIVKNELLSTIYTAYIDKANVASLSIYKDTTSYCLHDVFVKEDFRGKGYAKALLNYTLSDILKDKLPIILHVSTNNIPAVTLYSNNGFNVEYQLDYYEINNQSRISNDFQ